MTFDDDKPTLATRSSVIFLVVLFVLIGSDVIEDAGQGVEWGHMLLEISIEVVILIGIATLWRRMLAMRSQTVHLERDLARAHEETQRWREEAHTYLQGLGQAIDRQFERWNLTAAEREIGLLLLKGLSHKEIANIRKTNEQTVRQQSLSLYRKSGLSGRNDLSAFFLEDLLLPSSPGEAPGRSP
ncbi:MAG TPA: helix-turn-helix transcriptional regulator [Burkholderiaceae bacterium]|nr:helix-turn-helix transcriptional regulator [Burkholderiaceae bacterium]